MKKEQKKSGNRVNNIDKCFRNFSKIKVKNKHSYILLEIFFNFSASSFAFTVGSDSWEKREDGSYLRTINSIKELFDVSPVWQPAYSDTSVDTRGLDQLRDKEELEDYYKELESKITK